MEIEKIDTIEIKTLEVEENPKEAEKKDFKDRLFNVYDWSEVDKWEEI